MQTLGKIGTESPSLDSSSYHLRTTLTIGQFYLHIISVHSHQTSFSPFKLSPYRITQARMIKLVDISQKWVLIVCGVFFLLSAVCFALRLYATRRKFSRIFADDWMMLVSLVSSTISVDSLIETDCFQVGLLLLTVGTYTGKSIYRIQLRLLVLMNCYTAVLIGGMGLNKGYVMNCYGKGPVEFLLLVNTPSLTTIHSNEQILTIPLYRTSSSPPPYGQSRPQHATSPSCCSTAAHSLYRGCAS
ncbi:hypothetical protein M501DRAFT_231317 [Patellaria atrata CBS 101060]|uniref:Uncharacterized protein n=1 Tax=Patellaria atrata CBS 101060 TaxID=1346257 RepID=A0A9P4S614_9PEZI|nr:hypothetical protein M501DRAFT_231317 [Patellaria atrata CBS 101060]